MSELDALEQSVLRRDKDQPTQQPPPVEDEADEELVELTGAFAGPPLQELKQLDFFIDQELHEDALRLLEHLEAEYPGDADVAQRRLALKSKGVLLEDVVQTSEGPEELFADEEEYIDLARELESELAEEEAMVEEATGHGREEAELEEVFREFQKGVSEQLSEEDSDTHFNLGIAYKEMGLLPEAIREFQISSRDRAYFVESCSMIGVCYLEQGMADQAAEWYRRALEYDELPDESRLALRYDLATALEMAGDVDQAIEHFETVAAASPGYRDTTQRLNHLGTQRRAN
jgi:tetratricopeptide (TPR) repeat protein